jgi:hypothetical protein
VSKIGIGQKFLTDFSIRSYKQHRDVEDQKHESISRQVIVNNFLELFGCFDMDSRLRGNDSGGARKYGVIPAQAGIHAAPESRKNLLSSTYPPP